MWSLKWSIVAFAALLLQLNAALAHESTAAAIYGHSQAAAAASDRLAEITNYSVSGTGCPEMTSANITYLDKATLTIIFDKFSVFGPPQNGGARRHVIRCEIVIYLQFSAEFASSNLINSIRTDLTIPVNASSSLTMDTSYGWEGLAERYKESVYKYPGPFDKIAVEKEVRAVKAASPLCRPFHGSLNLAYEYEISTWSRDQSVVQIFSLDYTLESAAVGQGVCKSKSS